MLHTTKVINLFLLVSAIIAFLYLPVHAQDMPEAKKREGVTYYVASFVKFKPGKADQARKIIYEHYVLADQAIGLPTTAFDFITGPWDHVAYFPLENGPEELEWELSPRNAEWRDAFIEQEGGLEEAQKIWTQFSELILERKKDIVMRREEGPGIN